MEKRIKQVLHDFRIENEMENISQVRKDVLAGIDFSGTNLWILIFAILIACLGLNVNSTAVVIGAMLVSPLMGPIVGMGFSLGMYDFGLLKKSFSNFLVMTIVSLLVSTLYFLITPIHQAYSEILARTSPTLFDVLIALSGGLAGVFALFSKKKGNVIPGVAIATALMPPLCTAGYGIANGSWKFFGGALFLYTINSVFIGLSNYAFVSYYARTHRNDMLNEKLQNRVRTWLTIVVLLMVIPSVVFAVRMVSQERFTSSATTFIEKEVNTSDYLLLDKKIDPSTKTITLTFGGVKVDSSYIKKMSNDLTKHYDPDAKLVVRQGFDIQRLQDEQKNTLMTSNDVLEDKVRKLEIQIDSLQNLQNRKLEIAKDLIALDSNIADVYINKEENVKKYDIFIKTTNGKKPNQMSIDRYMSVNLDSAPVRIYYIKE